MSYRIRNLESIHNNPLNLSPSKQQYTIPKAPRFRNSRSVCEYRYYTLPSTNKHKAPSFGASTRKGLFRYDPEIPPPGAYNPKDINVGTLSVSFAKGRNVCISHNMQECKGFDFLKVKDNPGPGAYNPNPEFVDPLPSSKFSIRGKTCVNFHPGDSVPGPGHYNVKTGWLEKEKILSNDRKFGAPLIRVSHDISV